ncbi:MAG TPA: hypothetical protein VK960_04265 [Acidimicrobiia bacterium]|nr:hypothetical protein [Acidimicrobiia bacterium]
MHIRRLMTLALSIALTASACGDDDGGGILTGTTTTAAPTTTTSTAAPSTTTTGASTTTSSTTVTTAPPDDGLGPFATFVSITHPFSVEYPESWDTEENSFGAVVTFLSPLTSADDPLRENVNVVVEDLGGVEVTLDEYLEVALSQLPSLIPDIQLNDQIDDIMGGVPSRIITYTGSQNGIQFNWVQEIALFEGSAYVLTYTGLSNTDDYVEFRAYAIEIFHSFDFRS